MKLGGFSHKIDYDKAIAQDQADIAMLAAGGPVDRLGQAVLAGRLPVGRDGWYPMDAGDALAAAAEWPDANYDLFVVMLGLMTVKEEHAALWGIAMDNTQGTFPEHLLERAKRNYPKYRDAAKISDEVLGRLRGVGFWSEADRKVALKKAKASLSRHRRNKEKWG
jgi:hypothetical protein